MKKKELRIVSIYEKVADACFCLRNFCYGENIGKKICSELELCLTEALNNIIKHAYKEDPLRIIDLTFTLNGIELEIKLEDSGVPRTNIQDPVLVYDPKDINTLPEGGMGLFIIKNLTDSVSYHSENGKNIFLMRKIV